VPLAYALLGEVGTIQAGLAKAGAGKVPAVLAVNSLETAEPMAPLPAGLLSVLARCLLRSLPRSRRAAIPPRRPLLLFALSKYWKRVHQTTRQRSMGVGKIAVFGADVSSFLASASRQVQQNRRGNKPRR